jgi:hypothetical protein
MPGTWEYIKATNVTRAVPSWGPGATQDYAVIVFVEDGFIVAAIDERVKSHQDWESLVDWGSGLFVPVSVTWRTTAFNRVHPLGSHHVGEGRRLQESAR